MKTKPAPALPRSIASAVRAVVVASRALEAAKETAGERVASAASGWQPGPYRVQVAGITVGVRVHRSGRAPSISYVRIPRTSQLVRLDQ